MKRKELKNLAMKIAKAEQQLQQATDSQEKHQLELKIMELSGRVTNINDMLLLDDMVQELLKP